MGRLFWKFFLAFWIAVLLSGVGVGTAIWLKKNNDQQAENSADLLTDAPPRPAREQVMLRLAQSLFAQGGQQSLVTLLEQTKQLKRGRLFAIDESGNELLGRSIDKALSATLWKESAADQFPEELLVVTDQSQQRWLIFSDFHLLQHSTSFGLARPVQLKPPKPPRAGVLHPRRSPPFRPMTLIILLGLISSLLLSFLLARFFAKPIRQLRLAQLALAEGKLDTRIGDKVTGNDELAELGRSFDFMAARLDSLVKSQKQLFHDVSHELRSPLARIQAAIGLAHQQPSKVTDMLPRIERETKKIDNLVSELLLLARLQNNLDLRHSQPVVLAELLSETVEDVRFEAQSTPIIIHFESSCSPTLQGDPELLQRAFENVLRNALKFTKTTIVVTLTCQERKPNSIIIVTIEDDGPGIEDADHERVFEPFFRSQSHERVPGVGLGLAIANRAIRVHHGSIQVSNRSSGGLVVSIELPGQ